MSTPLLQNILGQGEAVRVVGKYQLGEGRRSLLKSADLLRSRKRILLSGMGASYFACIPSYYGLLQRGLDAVAIETAELLYSPPSTVDENTAVVLVSRSGESVEVTRFLPILKERRSVIIGVANVPDSTLSTEADGAIILHSPADQFAAIQTYTATCVVLALLQAALFNELDRAEADLQKTAEFLDDLIPECVEQSKQWQGFLDGGQPVYLLGRGAALGAVSEGVLLMHEVAKSPAVGLSAAQFRHGPVEVVDNTFRGIIIGTQEETAHLDAALAEDLEKMGGQVRWVGPLAKRTKVTPLCSWPDDMPARFASVIETIPLQLAAYRKAEIRGLTPGEFRWAPLVTTTEAGFAIRETQ